MLYRTGDTHDQQAKSPAVYPSVQVSSHAGSGEDRLLPGPVGIDETYLGGKARDRHASQRDGKRGVDGKWAVVGILDRAMGQVQAEAVDDIKKVA